LVRVFVLPETPSESPSKRQLQTQNARRAFRESFATDEERREHYRQLARRSNAGRVVLRPDEAAALGEAYKVLAKLAARGKIGVAAEGQEGDKHAA
jgi:hypothetical protein